MPISCETCRETLHSYLADFIETKNGEAPAGVPALAQTSIEASKQEATPLSSTQRGEIETHLAQCSLCSRELALLRGMTTELHNLPSVPAPPDLRARIQSQLASEVRAAAQPIATREQTTGRNAPPSWIQRWRDFWHRPTRVAWAGVALTGFLLLLATQSNVPFPSSGSDSAPTPESAPPAALAPPETQSQTTVRKAPRTPAPGAAKPQQNTARSASTKSGNTRSETQRATSPVNNGSGAAPIQRGANDVPVAGKTGAPPAQQRPEESTRIAGLGDQKALSQARKTAAPSQDAATHSALSPAAPSRQDSTNTPAAKSARPATTSKNRDTPDNALPTRDTQLRDTQLRDTPLFARLQVESRAEESAAHRRRIRALEAAPAMAAPATAPAPLRQNDSVAGAAADSSEQRRGAGGFSGNADAPPQTETFSLRRRNATSAGGEPPRLESAPSATAQGAAPDDRQKTASEALRTQGAARGNATSTQTTPESPANADKGATKTLSRSAVSAHNDSTNDPSDGNTTVAARLMVTLPRDVPSARLRIVGSANVRLSQNGVLSQIVWSGTARPGQEIAVALNLRIAAPGTLRVILEEAHGSGWKPVREQILSVSSR